MVSPKRKILHESNLGESRHHHRRKFTENLLDRAIILPALDIQADYTLIDAGCGNGYMAKAFSRQAGPNGAVYALDTDPIALEILAREIQGTNIKPLLGDICGPTPIPGATVDLLYISAVVHGFSKFQMTDFLDEARRLLKPGATLAIVEIEKQETAFGPPLSIRLSPEDLIDAIPLVPSGTLSVGEHFYMQLFINREKNGPNL